jgi:hypothetical protein
MSEPNEMRALLVLEVPGRKPLGSAMALTVATNGWKVISTSSVQQAIQTIETTPELRAFVCNDPNLQTFKAARCRDDITTVLVTDLPMHEYSKALELNDVQLIDHIIANLDTEWTSADIAITLQKILRRDIFGIEKYLSPESNIQKHIVKGSADREVLNKTVLEWVDACGAGKNISRMAHGISEELLMNAIYDAPVAGGRTHYEDMERTSKRELLPDEWATLKFGIDSRLLAISIEDPFGAFLRDKWFSYLRKALRRNDSDNLIDTKKGGAGLGLFKMLYSSHGVVCNVDPGKKTEVIILINLSMPIRDFIHMPRSIHYFKI